MGMTIFTVFVILQIAVKAMPVAFGKLELFAIVQKLSRNHYVIWLVHPTVIHGMHDYMIWLVSELASKH